MQKAQQAAAVDFFTSAFASAKKSLIFSLQNIQKVKRSKA